MLGIENRKSLLRIETGKSLTSISSLLYTVDEPVSSIENIINLTCHFSLLDRAAEPVLSIETGKSLSRNFSLLDTLAEPARRAATDSSAALAIAPTPPGWPSPPEGAPPVGPGQPPAPPPSPWPPLQERAAAESSTPADSAKSVPMPKLCVATPRHYFHGFGTRLRIH